jgi:hypothetical protein
MRSRQAAVARQPPLVAYHSGLALREQGGFRLPKEKPMKRRWAGCLCLCLSLGVAACSSNEYGEYPPYPASGQLLINGKPAKDAVLTFYLDGYKGDRTILPQGWTDENGHFVLSTYKQGDGAPAGDYKVSVRWPTTRKGFGMGPDALQGKYSDQNASGLVAHIEKGTNELKPFELTAEEKKPGGKRTIKKGINVREVDE